MAKKFKKIIFFAVTALMVFNSTLPVFAGDGAIQAEVWKETQRQMGPLANIFGGNTDLRLVIANLLKYFLTIVGLIFLVYIVYAGVNWMTAAGNSDKIEKAKETLRTGIIGMMVIIFAFAIARFVIIAARCATDTSGSWCAFLNNIAW